MADFTREAAERIGRATLYVKRMVKNVRRGRRGRWQGSGGGGGYQFRVFELKTDLAAGGTATAYRRAYDTIAADDVTDLGSTFTVWDYIGDRTGTGRDNVSTTTSHGWYGVAMKLPGEAVWRVIDLQCP